MLRRLARWFQGDAEAPVPRTLAELRPGQRGRVTGVRCDSPTGQRILELGILDGVELTMVRRAPAGDPLEVRLPGSTVSLRRSEARQVAVEVVS